MPNIRPISDLRNYPTVLNDVETGSPVYLTKNGRGCFAILDIKEAEIQQTKANEYDKLVEELKLMCELNKGRKTGEEEGWLSESEVKAYFARKHNEK